MRRLRHNALLALLAVFFTLAAALVPLAAHAKVPDCGEARVVLEGGTPSPFVLPQMAGQTLEVDPEQPVTLRGENVPPGAQLRLSVAGLGGRAGVTRGVSGGVTQVRIADYVPLKGGLYALDGTLLASGREVCTVRFSAKLGEFGGPVAVGSAAASAVAGAAALGSAASAASGVTVNLKARVALQRRRPTGIRRWLPAPNVKRTIISMFTGALTGVCITVLLQQGGITPLSVAAAVKGAITGGAVTLGVGYSIGAIITYLRPPKAA